MSDVRSIWKFTLTGQEESFEMPIGARVLCVQEQGGKPCVWAMVDPQEVTEIRRFAAIGTGWNLDAGMERATYHGPRVYSVRPASPSVDVVTRGEG